MKSLELQRFSLEMSRFHAFAPKSLELQRFSFPPCPTGQNHRKTLHR